MQLLAGITLLLALALAVLVFVYEPESVPEPTDLTESAEFTEPDRLNPPSDLSENVVLKRPEELANTEEKKPLRSLLAEASALLRGGELDRAKAQLAEIIRLHSKGLLALRDDQFPADDVALIDLVIESAVNLESWSIAEAWLLRHPERELRGLGHVMAFAEVLGRAEKYEQAIRLREEIRRSKPLMIENQRALALLYLAAERVEGLQELANELLTTPGQESVALFFSGKAYALQSRWDEAIRAFDRALAYRPGARELVVAKADALYRRSGAELTHSWLEGLMVDAQDAHAAFLRGQLYRANDQFEEAKRMYESAIAWSPEWLAPRQALATITNPGN